jgi:acyl-CoA synthetase (AMP-forming)/AMP-acid ligase II
MVMSGYWNRPEQTAATLLDGKWLRTGDAARRDQHGRLYLQDRVKDMVVTGGENVYPAEVENALMKHPQVAECAVIGVPSAQWTEAVKAIVVLRRGATVDEKELIAHCRRLLAGYKCPKSVEFAKTLPRTPTGKIQKFLLREMHTERKKPWAEFSK